MKSQPWYTTSYRRNLVDMHIEDWDESFLSRFDPEKYVQLLKTARVQTAMVYANSHVGYSYWPTKSGRMHRGIRGRDILGEVVRGCHSAGMSVVVYFSLIFNNLAYEMHPDWRLLDSKGEPSREGDKFKHWLKPRYGICCPNSLPYRDFVETQLREICESYEFEGMFFDMNFWPDVCYCANCRERYQKEVGRELPLVIDWTDEKWTTFQSKREEWLAEMAIFASSTAKRLKPGISTQHNFAQITINWEFGFTDRMLPSSDYLGGDFYGSFMHGSFIAKLLGRMSRGKPFEYMTSRCHPGLTFHTDTKPKDILRLTNFIALANRGALLFIDAINLDGSQDPRVYKLMGEVFEESMKFEEFVGGDPVADVGIYFGLDSKVNPRDNGQAVADYHGDKGRYPHLDASVGAARILKDNHVPFGVITRADLPALSTFRTLVVADAYRLDSEEVAAITRFIREGGSVYASGYSILHLSEVFHTKSSGRTEEEFTYIAPDSEDDSFLPGVTVASPLSIPQAQVVVETTATASVKAHIGVPFTKPRDPVHFASIHSNPPGKVTAHPALLSQTFGKGKAVWVSAPIEKEERWAHAAVFMHLIRKLHGSDFRFSTDAPAQVEVTVFDQPENSRWVVNLVNMQDRMPALPVFGLTVKLVRAGRTVKAVTSAPASGPLKWKLEKEYVSIEIPRLDLFTMVLVSYA